MINIKQVSFIDYILQGNNQQESAIKAGYGMKGARTTAYMLLKKPEIQAEIKRRREEVALKAKMTQEDYAKQTYDHFIASKAEGIRLGYWKLLGDIWGYTNMNKPLIGIYNQSNVFNKQIEDILFKRGIVSESPADEIEEQKKNYSRCEEMKEGIKNPPTELLTPNTNKPQENQDQTNP